MAIVGYIGAIGTGKTMNAVRDALATAKRRDALLVSNIRIVDDAGVQVLRLRMTHDGIDTDTLRELVYECQQAGRGMVLLLDEVGVLMPARFWSDFPIDLVYVLSQSRKLGVDLIYTAQDVEQVDAILRRLTTFVWLVKAWPVPSIERREAGRRPWVFLLTKWKAKHIETAFRQPMGRSVVRYRREWEGLYSTDELVAPPERLRERHRRRRTGSAEGAGAGSPPLAAVVRRQPAGQEGGAG